MAAEGNIEIGYPKNLAYNLKELLGGFNKQKVKVLGDLQTTAASGVVHFKLPANAIVYLHSLVLYFTGSTAGTGSTTSYIHFPRYSSLLLQKITIVLIISLYAQLMNMAFYIMPSWIWKVLTVLNTQKE